MAERMRPNGGQIMLGVLLLNLLAWLTNAHAEPEPLLKDSEISAAIDRSLAGDTMVPHKRIQVSTKDGITTLRGVVPNLVAKDQAVRHAESIKGVRVVVDRLNVRTVRRSDEELSKQVQEALRIDPATKSLNVNVSVQDGRVTISGTVQSWAEKELATEAAKSVKGVASIRNFLTIEPQAHREDMEIEADIKRRFQSDVWLIDRDLLVQVKNGVAHLKGTVGSILEKSHATTLAYVLGITDVNIDGLTVEWSSRTRMRRSAHADPTDDEIARAVKDAVLQDPRIRSLNPAVQVRAGAVILTGSVSNLAAKRAAEENARHTVGVRTVTNRLEVERQEDTSDQMIAGRVRYRLSDHPVIDRDAITVSVRNGVVSLNGAVDNPIAQRTAEELAEGVAGVVEVINDLEVKVLQLGRSDDDLRSAITSQLWWSPFVDEDRVWVDVRHGVVTLTGTVETLWEKKFAEDNAREAGARVVQNDLRVHQSK
ncbi:MAG: BON domain-containing protein [Nitrospira sp.]